MKYFKKNLMSNKCNVYLYMYLSRLSTVSQKTLINIISISASRTYRCLDYLIFIWFLGECQKLFQFLLNSCTTKNDGKNNSYQLWCFDGSITKILSYNMLPLEVMSSFHARLLFINQTFFLDWWCEFKSERPTS